MDKVAFEGGGAGAGAGGGGGLLLTLNNGTNATSSPSPLSFDSLFSLATVVVSSCSLVGLVFAFITYSLFSDLRSLAGTTLMNLFAALFLSQLLFVVGVERDRDWALCRSLAVALLYLAAAVFLWLACMTHHLYLACREYLLLGVPRLQHRMAAHFCRYSLVSWGGPLAVVVAVVALLPGSSSLNNANASAADDNAAVIITSSSSSSNNCWLVGSSSVWLLASLIVVVVVFMVVYSVKVFVVVRYVASLQVSRKLSRKMTRSRHLQLCLYLRLFLLQLLVWSCAIVARLAHSTVAWLAFQCLFATQGVLVAVAFTCNRRVLKLYATTLRPRNQPGKDYNSATAATDVMSQSNSLQLLTWEPPPDAV